MESKTIVIDLPPGVGRVCITTWPADETKPHGWEEVAVAPPGTSAWLPVELTGGSFEVQDERGSVIRSSTTEAA